MLDKELADRLLCAIGFYTKEFWEELEVKMEQLSKKADITWILIPFEKVRDGLLSSEGGECPADLWEEIIEAAIDGARDAIIDRIIELFREGAGDHED